MKVRIFLPPLVCLVAGILLCGCSAPQSMPASTAPSPVATTAAPAQAPATIRAVSRSMLMRLFRDLCSRTHIPAREQANRRNSHGRMCRRVIKSLVLIVDDPDAPKGTFMHWFLYNIPPATRRIDRAQPNAKVLANGAQQGDTSTGTRGLSRPARRSGRLTGTSSPCTRSITILACRPQTGTASIGR